MLTEIVCYLMAAVAPCETAFEKVFARWEEPVPAVVATAVERFAADDGLLRVETFATTKRYLFMPPPGRPRIGTARSIQLSDVEAAYVDLYGRATVTVDSINYEIAGEGWRSVNVLPGRLCVLTECRPIEAARGMSISVVPDGGVVSNIQYYSDGAWQRRTVGKASTAGAGWDRMSVAEWAKLSQTLYLDALILADGLGMCSQFEGAGCEVVRRGAKRHASRVLAAISQWPFWGPYDEAGTDWDQGSWSLGYLPAAAAIFASMPGVDFDLSDAWKRLVIDPIGSSRFPSVRHWIRRSTNHAAIIYGGLIGGALLQNGCRRNSFSERMLREFEAMSAAAFADGFYLESSAYTSIYLYNSIFGAIVLAGCEGRPLGEVFDEYYARHLEQTATSAALISRADGERWLDYGDASVSHWSSNARRMFANYNAFWHDIPVESAVPGMEERIAAVADELRPVPDDFCNVFEDAGVAVVGDDHTRLGVVSMPLHLTHNRDWSLGSMVLEVDGQTVFGRKLGIPKRQSRAASAHSTSWIEPADEACFGRQPRCSGRTSMNGTIRARVKSDDTCVVAARGNARRLHRVFAVAPVDDGLYVTVFDVADLEEGENIHVNLVRRSDDAEVAVRQASTTWRDRSVEITQIWTGGGACTEGEIVRIEGATAHIWDCESQPLMAVSLNDIMRRP